METLKGCGVSTDDYYAVAGWLVDDANLCRPPQQTRLERASGIFRWVMEQGGQDITKRVDPYSPGLITFVNAMNAFVEAMTEETP